MPPFTTPSHHLPTAACLLVDHSRAHWCFLEKASLSQTTIRRTVVCMHSYTYSGGTCTT